ncbi:uncharacterized protein EI90DRAFT_3065502 [Cantharellus anzutake]|uniref:uncharacterized protein n=1 Tax=Cantharellus anzutake TaxID=1750568 RepID=UPI001903D6C9|nr:uncharacterized protein EI90DRAFT_3065502 [Cantharellus anzutake]KAF8328078.1 hypothetical protein EI90DRAFT_3065502 [Cantharellus anzutake]
MLSKVSFLVGLCIVSSIAWTALRHHVKKTTMVFSHFELLRTKRNGKKVEGTAVIAGGSISGYATARILSDYFTQVVIIEPDHRIERTATRVAQRGHIHFPLPMTIIICRALYQGFDEAVRRMGYKIRPSFRRLIFGSLWNWRSTATHPGLEYHRVQLEEVFRELAASYVGDSLEVIQGTVTNLHTPPAPQSASISAVSYRPSMESAETVTLPCVFFADCSGANAIASKLLPQAAADHSKPNSTTTAIVPHWGPYTRHSYSPNAVYRCFYVPVKGEKLKSRIAKLVPRNDPNWGNWDELTLLYFQLPMFDVGGCGKGPREGIIIEKVFDNEVLMNYIGVGDVTPPSNLAQLDQIFRDTHEELFKLNPALQDISLWVYELFDLFRESQVDDEIQILPAKLSTSWYIDYLSAPTPNNFVAVGDSVMFVNPLFAQGMMKALGSVTVLNTALHRHITDSTPDANVASLPISRSYFELANQICIPIYDLNRSLDFGFLSSTPQEGDTLEYGARFRAYWKYLNQASQKNTMVANTLDGVVHGVRPGVDLFNPIIVARVLWERLLG